MDDRRIYSLNIMAYIIASGVNDYRLVEDEEQAGKYYMVVEQDINDLKEKYKNDNNLIRYLQSFKKLKKEISKKRYHQ